MQADALRASFLQYLGSTFGDEFAQFLDTPPDARVGERVLYKLADGSEAARREPTPEDLAGMRDTLTDIARRTGADPNRVTLEPPVSSGLPYPRLLDLRGLIMWDTDLARYLNSRDALPSPGFMIQWALGVALLPSEKMLLYLNFIHPTVKAIFRASYDEEGLPGGRAGIREGFAEFRNRVQEAVREAVRRPELLWIKVIRVDGQPTVIRSSSR
jgi:hypothetical protein